MHQLMAGASLRVTAAAVLLGAGTAMIYPTLLAVIGDVPRTRAQRDRAAGRGKHPGSPSDRNS